MRGISLKIQGELIVTIRDKILYMSFGVITLLFVFSLLFVVGCEDEPVKVVKTKPKPSADDWIGTWEIELINGESYSDLVVKKEFTDWVTDDREEDDPQIENVRVSATYVFANNGTYFLDFRFDVTILGEVADGLFLKLTMDITGKSKGIYAISSSTYTFIDESSEVTLKVSPRRIGGRDAGEIEREFYHDHNSDNADYVIELFDNVKNGRWYLRRGKLVLYEDVDDGEETQTLTLKKKL